MKREVLEKPFEQELIKTRRGHSGKSLSYVEGMEYVRRLNEAFDGHWSFEVVEHQIMENEVIVVGKLTADSVVKVTFGGSSITRNHHTGEPMSIADDLKAAATDSLKKASSLLGLGLHLYGDRPTTSSSPPQNKVALVPPASSQTNAQKKLTERQLAAILAISRSQGWSRSTLDQHCRDTYGALPAKLSKSDASDLIDSLRALPADKAA